IARVLSGERPLTVWGDGTPIRDFIHARDVALGMLKMVEQGITEPVNLGSGDGVTIRKIVEVITSCFDEEIEVKWDTSKPSGDKLRIMDMTRAKSYGFSPSVSIDQGIRETIEWYVQNRKQVSKRYNVFTESKYF
ncbi:MAG: GDP-mannose 4,6-dehydratase, partial [Zetaproteobacteria bacterium]|nr:GDP-mannose 4,6-dehydratase [Zetaproteobacteria bacterium]